MSIQFDTTGLSSDDLKYQADRMVIAYRKAVRRELREIVATYEERGTPEGIRLELARIVGSNRSTWSGGHSVSNVCEQILREEANDLLTDLLRKEC